jgi:hypothetical protein
VQTDGRCIRYGTAFDAEPLPVQAALVAHEVLHIALRHPQRYLELQQLLGDVDLQLFNICVDAIVNSALGHLGWLQLPPRSVRLEELLSGALALNTPAESALLQWDVEQLYRAVDDRGARGSGKAQQRGGGQGRSESGDGAEAAGQAAARADGPVAARVRQLGRHSPRDLLPGPQDNLRPEDEAEATREWSERLQRAHAGDGEHSLLRTLLADLPRPRTPWEQVLRTQLARALWPQRSLSSSRPLRSYLANQGRQRAHRRMPFQAWLQPEPARAAAGAGGRRVGLDRRRADGALRPRDRGHHPAHRGRLAAGDRRRAGARGRPVRARALRPARDRVPRRWRHRLHAAAGTGRPPCARHRDRAHRRGRPGALPAGLPGDLGRA